MALEQIVGTAARDGEAGMEGQGVKLTTTTRWLACTPLLQQPPLPTHTKRIIYTHTQT